MQKNNSFYLLLVLSLLFGFLILHGCFNLYMQEGFEDEKKKNKSTKKEKDENNLDEKTTSKELSKKNNQKTKSPTKKIKVKTFSF